MLLLMLGFPIVLLGLLALMEWIEAPLRCHDSAAELPKFLDTAQADEIEVFVRNGYKAALDRHWQRQRMIGRLNGARWRRSDPVNGRSPRRTLAHSRVGGSGGSRAGAGTAVRGAGRGLSSGVAVSRTDTSVPTR
jgi:hypothetical protein